MSGPAASDAYRIAREEIQARVTPAQLFVDAGLPRRGGRFACPNPTHTSQSRKPDLTAGPNSRTWKCQSCGEGGSVFDAAVFLGLASDFSAALQYLADRVGVTLPRSAREARRPQPWDHVPDALRKEIRGRVVDWAARRFAPDCPGAEYLAARGIPFDIAERARVGWIPNVDDFTGALRKRWSRLELIAAGQLSQRTPHRPVIRSHQLTIPADHGTTYGARLARRPRTDREIKELCIGPGDVFGAHLADPTSSGPDGIMLICEGSTDYLAGLAIGLPTIGYPGATRWRMIVERAAELLPPAPARIVLIPDGDADGYGGARRLRQALVAALPDGDDGTRIRLLTVPPGCDLNGLVCEHGASRVREWLALAARAGD